jgi:hypothetical protein
MVVDLKSLPDRAFEKRLGLKRVLYYLEFDIAMIFRSTLEFQFLFEGEVIGKTEVKYV